MIRVALTGTPGVGKTTLAAHARQAGWRVVDVKAWASEVGAVVEHDEEDAADVIDVDVLRAKQEAVDTVAQGNEGMWQPPVLYEGHLSHYLDVDVVWVLRLDPLVLRARLEARGYPSAKVSENLEAEALDIILQEALETGLPVRQRDGTRRNPEALWQAFAEGGFDCLKGRDLEAVDWSDRLPL